jgi:hypothetical protein
VLLGRLVVLEFVSSIVIGELGSVKLLEELTLKVY